MKRWNKISLTLLVTHVVIVCLLSGWSYCDVKNLELGIYFKLGYLLNLPLVVGHVLEMVIYFWSLFAFPLTALLLPIFYKKQVVNSGERLLCHVFLSIFQFYALLPLVT
ncbi:hypothetical protein UABAM_04544 [Candidatus Uabimicrobium amorphum]|uniref:Uncharacterized protein n=1 Tax=Uabimicrobium amorphum TaxID=2596890 RepID=A0A5S9IQD3_UABAM|nr:hypothetical protein [Candidatus Uabimicrobium amorphum]BBM86158.1 hypothetical protein UABAM_04544 [Candidatus Uabimicrobium amorphum]